MILNAIGRRAIRMIPVKTAFLAVMTMNSRGAGRIARHVPIPNYFRFLPLKRLLYSRDREYGDGFRGDDCKAPVDVRIADPQGQHE